MLRLGRVEVTGGFLLLMAWLNYTDTQGLLPAALCAATAHELGHLAAIRALGGHVTALRLSAVGAELRLGRSLSYGRELLCALAGPAVNLVLARLAALWGGEELLVFAGMNLALGCFNLLPVSALDGGKCLYCAGALVCSDGWADRLGGAVDRALAGLLALAGAAALGRGGGVTLLLVAVWLFWGSGAKVGGKGVVKGRRSG